MKKTNTIEELKNTIKEKELELEKLKEELEEKVNEGKLDYTFISHRISQNTFHDEVHYKRTRCNENTLKEKIRDWKRMVKNNSHHYYLVEIRDNKTGKIVQKIEQ